MTTSIATRPTRQTVDVPAAVPVRVFVLADGEIVRHAIRARLASLAELDVVGVDRSSAQVAGRIRASRPDLVVIHAGLADRDMILCSRSIRSTESAPPVLLVGTLDTEESILVALLAGAGAYALRFGDDDEWTQAVQKAVSGDGWDRAAVDRALDALRTRLNRPRLNAAEMSLMAYVARGISDEKIAGLLGADHPTVRRDVLTLVCKLHAQRTAPW